MTGWRVYSRSVCVYFFVTAQLFDLGYELGDYKTTFDLQTILEQLDEQLSLVLMREYLDESLVLLQRTLCWNLRDMLYLKRLDIVTMTTDGVEDEWSSEETKVRLILFFFLFQGSNNKQNPRKNRYPTHTH